MHTLFNLKRLLQLKMDGIYMIRLKSMNVWVLVQVTNGDLLS